MGQCIGLGATKIMLVIFGEYMVKPGKAWRAIPGEIPGINGLSNIE